MVVESMSKMGCGHYPVGKLYVGKALGFACVPVHDDAHINNFASSGEKLEELFLAGPQWQVVCKYSTDIPIQLHQLPFSLSLLSDLWWRFLSPTCKGNAFLRRPCTAYMSPRSCLVGMRY